MKKPLLATYATNKSILQLTPDDIRKLDVVYFSFVRVDGSRADISELTNVGRMKELRYLNPNLKIVLTAASGQEGGFPAALESAEKLSACAKSLIDLVKQYDFDGLDIDWEYPSNEIEKFGHTALMAELREQLDGIGDGKKRQLSIAAGCKQWYFDITDLTHAVQYLDYVNLMTYDINANNTYTVHHCCTYPMDTDKETEGSVQENAEVFIRNGVPAEKLIVGAAFYSRQWKNVENTNNGLFAYAGAGSDYGPGYTQLMRDYINADSGFTRYWDDTAKAPYLFNGNTFITYDDKESLEYKCDYVKKAHLAGIMIWEYSYDEEHKLVEHMYNALTSDTI